MQNSWIVIIPPIFLLFMAAITKNVILSLLSGIIVACFVVSDFSVVGTIKLSLQRLLEQTEIPNIIQMHGPFDNILTFLFLILLGIIICLITHTGGMAAYTCAIQKKLHSTKAVQVVSLCLSSCFFMDDYLNTLTVGSIMRPLTDQFKIPRAKLAFLLDSMSSALCLIVPASSWVAFTLLQLQDLTKYDALSLYLPAIPFILYSWFIIFTAWTVVLLGISYGKLKGHEQIALETGNLFGGAKEIHMAAAKNPEDCSLSDFFIPISLFISTVFLFFTYTGSWLYFGGQNSLFKALQKGDPFSSLFLASATTLTISLIYFFARKKLNSAELIYVTKQGFDLMKNSIILLLLAKTMSMILKSDLQTGPYLANVLLGSINTSLLPVIFFVVTSLIAIATGSSWGTISVMLPIAVPMVDSLAGTPFAPVIGAVLSGSVVGAHLSPISDPMLISSTSAGSYHIDHVETQISYAWPAMFASLISYILVGLIYSKSSNLAAAVGIITGLIITFSILLVLNKKTAKD